MGLATRYNGLQTKLNGIDSDGCYFLSLCSIAEEYNARPVDLINAVNFCYDQKLIKDKFTVQNDILILEHLTGKKWRRVVSVTLPEIKDNMYTVAVYYNPITKYIHFRRRSVDTLINSVTVREGYIKEYRVFTVEEK